MKNHLTLNFYWPHPIFFSLFLDLIPSWTHQSTALGEGPEAYRTLRKRLLPDLLWLMRARKRAEILQNQRLPAGGWLERGTSRNTWKQGSFFQNMSCCAAASRIIQQALIDFRREHNRTLGGTMDLDIFGVWPVCGLPPRQWFKSKTLGLHGSTPAASTSV